MMAGSRHDSCSRRRLRSPSTARTTRDGKSGGWWNPLVDTRQVRSPGRAAQPGTSARRSGTGRKGARTACRWSRAGAAAGACTAAGAASPAASDAKARARRSGRVARAHASLALQGQNNRCRDRARSRARGSDRDLGSVPRQHLELPRNRAAHHTATARAAAGDYHERARRNESISPRRRRSALRQDCDALPTESQWRLRSPKPRRNASQAACLPRAGRPGGAAR
jgi:hypothetical protein